LILSAQGGVSGAFSDVTSNLAFLDPSLVYTVQNVFLALTRNDVRFCEVAITLDQCSVGNAISAEGSHSALYLALVNQTEAGARQAFDALSGEVHASTASVLVDESRYVRQAVLGRLRQASYLGEGGPFAYLGMGGPVLASAGQEPSYALAYGEKTPLPVTGVPVIEKAPTPVPGLTFWTQALGAWGRLGTDRNAATAKHDLGGFFLGVDTLLFDSWRLGAAGGYTHSEIKVDARSSRADVDTTHLAAYAGRSWGPVNLRLGGAYAWHDIDTSRSIVFPGFVESATASYHGETGQAFGELGYGFVMGQVAAEPFAGLAWVRVRTGGLAERGGLAALFGAETVESVGYSSLGARVATSIALANGMALIPRASVAWQHAFDDVTPVTALAFESAGAGFRTFGVPIARDSALVEAGFDVALTPRAKLGLSYVGALAERTQDHAAKGNFSWSF
jgi:outer membrane autotransporter protein